MAPGTVGTCSCGRTLVAPGKQPEDTTAVRLEKVTERLNNVEKELDAVEAEQRLNKLQWTAVWWLIGAVVAGAVALMGGLLLR